MTRHHLSATILLEFANMFTKLGIQNDSISKQANVLVLFRYIYKEDAVGRWWVGWRLAKRYKLAIEDCSSFTTALCPFRAAHDSGV